MSRRPAVNELLERNKSLADFHRPWGLISELSRKPPTLIVACGDPRSDPRDIFGLQYGDAIALRTIGGRVIHAIEDIIAADCLLKFDNILIVHHTDCGVTYMTDDGIKQNLVHELGAKPEEVDSMQLPCYTDPMQSIREDLKLLKESKLIRKELLDNTTGHVYDIKTGLLTSV